MNSVLPLLLHLLAAFLAVATVLAILFPRRPVLGVPQHWGLQLWQLSLIGAITRPPADRLDGRWRCRRRSPAIGAGACGRGAQPPMRRNKRRHRCCASSPPICSTRTSTSSARCKALAALDADVLVLCEVTPEARGHFRAPRDALSPYARYLRAGEPVRHPHPVALPADAAQQRRGRGSIAPPSRRRPLDRRRPDQPGRHPSDQSAALQPGASHSGRVRRGRAAVPRGTGRPDPDRRLQRRRLVLAICESWSARQASPTTASCGRPGRSGCRRWCGCRWTMSGCAGAWRCSRPGSAPGSAPTICR